MRGATWGDTVRIKASAVPEYRPGALASVCGIREVETEEQSREFGAAIGGKLYLIEFGDGESIEVAAEWLTKVEE